MTSLCQCLRCLRERDERIGGQAIEYCRMVLCETCGCKRCPHATDHRQACTNDNSPGQHGSWYGSPPLDMPPTPPPLIANRCDGFTERKRGVSCDGPQKCGE